MSASDEQLLHDWRGGDDRAGSELFGRHFDELYGFFRSRVDTSEIAEDLVQQTMLTCVRRRDALRHGASFRAYLFTVARSRLIDSYRRRGAGQDVGPVSSLTDPGKSPSTWFRETERSRIFRAAFSRLSFDHQLVLELHYVRDFSGAQLATILEVPEGTIRSRLRRARARLAALMTELQETGLDEDDARASLAEWAGAVRAGGPGDGANEREPP